MERVNATFVKSDERNKCLSAFSVNDSQIKELFSRIQEIIDSIDISTANDTVCSNTLIRTEYLVTKIRLIVTKEQILVKQMLSTSTSPVVLGLFRNRDTYLGLINQRLNELREDATVIQKLIHTKTFQKL